MDRGTLTDFYGNPVNHRRELPAGIGRRYHEFGLGDLMPTDSGGMTLSAFEPRDDVDPVCLHDRFGRIVKQWPDGYMPGREEVRQAVYDELRKEGRRV